LYKLIALKSNIQKTCPEYKILSIQISNRNYKKIKKMLPHRLLVELINTRIVVVDNLPEDEFDISFKLPQDGE
jgi:hypothetical protein